MSQIYYPNARAVLKLIFDGFGETAQDSEQVIIPLLPISVSIQRNSYKQADSWEMTFNATDMPIDPALLRAGFIEIFLFQTTTLITGNDPRVIDQQFTDIDDIVQQRPRDLIGKIIQEAQLTSLKDRFTTTQKPQIAGQIDEVSTDMGSSGKTVTLTGQDFTAFLIGRTWPFKEAVTASTTGNRKKKFISKRIPVNQRLDELILKLIKEVDTTDVLELVVEEIDPKDLPIVGANEVNSHRRGIPVKQGANYWDIIYKLATRYGFIIYVRGVEVVLSRPKLLRDRLSPHIKKLAWGRNIENLRMTRNMGKEKVPRIIMRGYDEAAKELISVEFPPRGQPAPVGTVGTEEDEYQIFTVHGVSDRDILLRSAENLFELLGRGERQVVINTNDLRDLSENNMLDLDIGDPIEVEFLDQEERDIISNRDLGEDEKYERLVARGYNARVARLIAESYDKLILDKRPMRLKSFRMDFSVDDGISMEIEVIDYVVIDGMRTPENKTPSKVKAKNRIRRRDGSVVGNPVLESST